MISDYGFGLYNAINLDRSRGVECNVGRYYWTSEAGNVLGWEYGLECGHLGCITVVDRYNFDPSDT